MNHRFFSRRCVRTAFALSLIAAFLLPVVVAAAGIEEDKEACFKELERHIAFAMLMTLFVPAFYETLVALALMGYDFCRVYFGV